MSYYKKIEFTKNEIEYLKSKDGKIKKLIDLVGDIDREYIPDPFIALVNSIIFQQLSYKAGLTIWNRFVSLVMKITPENVLNASFEALRECGLSKSKINYIKNIAEAVQNGDLDIENLHKLSDEEIIKELVKIKGIGIWTAEMFLIFSLNRRNILSYGDLGIRKGLKWLYNMDEEPTKDDFQKFKERYSPYNTLASFYLWEITIRKLDECENIEDAVNRISIV